MSAKSPDTYISPSWCLGGWIFSFHLLWLSELALSSLESLEDLLAHCCNPSTWEKETGGSRAPGLLWLLSELKASLGYVSQGSRIIHCLGLEGWFNG